MYVYADGLPPLPPTTEPPLFYFSAASLNLNLVSIQSRDEPGCRIHWPRLPNSHLDEVSPKASDRETVWVRNNLETKPIQLIMVTLRGGFVTCLFRFATALGTAAALDSAGFRTLDVMVGNPFLIESLGTSCDGRRIDISGHSNLRLARSLLVGLAFLLWEVGEDPHGVEEIANTHCGCKEEDVEEEPLSRLLEIAYWV